MIWITSGKIFFTKMCEKNDRYQGPCAGQDFTDYRQEALEYAQGAFLMTVVWSQIANVLIRKTQVASSFTPERFFGNRVMLYSILFEIGVICIIVYPGGPGFQVRGDSLYCSVGLWAIPLLIIWDEIRKYLCRRDKNGWFFKYTVY
mmetsp:Transcript_9426/g.10149  ORF Transcript_9426/g.10149 Transcript_9426/m.10149 type:complete len:146 (-) Transcript_9426:519-956(-)